MDAAADPLARQRRAARSMATRERLAEAALRCVAAHGYGGAGVAEIASLAGLSRNHIFQHYGSKEALVQAALQRALAVWRGDVAQAAQIFPQPQRMLEHAAQKLAMLQGRDWPGLAFVAALAQCRAGLPEELGRALDDALEEMHSFFRSLFKEGRKSGVQRLEAKPRQLAQLCLAALLGAVSAGAQPAELLALLRSVLLQDAGQG